MGFLPATIAARLRLLQQSADEKRTVRKHHILVIFQLFHSPLFNQFSIFRAVTCTVISQPTDGFSSRRRHIPLSFIKTGRRHKMNGEKPLRFDEMAFH
jgi:hypothetical protein